MPPWPQGEHGLVLREVTRAVTDGTLAPTDLTA